MFTPAELKRRALDFSREHANDHDEKSQAQNFWRDFFGIFGLSPQRIGVFEARAKTLKGNVGFIDFFWPGTLLVEHKSRGRNLDEALKQALDYCTNGGLKDTELPRFIVVCDFDQFRLIELAIGEITQFCLAELHDNLHRFNFVLGYEQRKYKDEDPVNIMAAELMGDLHNELKRFGYSGHQLELFLVRSMFMMFADDTGIFPKDHMTYYLEAKTREDGSDFGPQLAMIFQILNTAPEQRQTNLDEDLLTFPYVNGQLFSESLSFPAFDAAMRHIFLRCCWFDWSKVSPAIFGSLFQSVMDANERRKLGAHYTSEKNILKTIHGLFLDELEADFAKYKIRRAKLGFTVLLQRIAKIRLLDPACGCGNFLILAYRELRRLEIKIHREIRKITGDQGQSLDVDWESRGITVDHIYGIEIEEFPSQIARVALWIMDHLMNVELAATLGGYRPSVPLVASPKIVHGNALRLDWREVVPPEELTYILGNPPFVGKHLMSKEQSSDMELVFTGKVKTFGILDFVTGWYAKAAEFLVANDKISVAFVSTNSITQGEQPGILWSYLFSVGVKIFFAHRTFKWTNEAKGNASVFCVIIGFSKGDRDEKTLYEYPDIKGEPVQRSARNISPYLANQSDVVIQNRNKPICNIPIMVYGSKPTDGGNLILSETEATDLMKAEPTVAPYIRQFIGSEEFINNIKRYCLWLVDIAPEILKGTPLVLGRIAKVKAMRLNSTKLATQKWADFPTVFIENRQPMSDYLAVPEVSSERRMYIPMGFVSKNVICSNKIQFVPNATLWVFGVLTSTMHMAWTRQVCGRLENRYDYSSKIVYNNFPWPKLVGSVEGSSPDSEKLKAKVELCAQAVLDARAEFPEASLADLYDPLTMPPVLVKAHGDLDAAVDKCYRKEAFGSELERVEFLFALYEEYTAGLLVGEKKIRRGKK